MMFSFWFTRTDACVEKERERGIGYGRIG